MIVVVASTGPNRAAMATMPSAATRIARGTATRATSTPDRIPAGTTPSHADVHVREVTGSARLRIGDALFAWVMAFPDHLELTGAAVTVERAHVERVRAALAAELASARLRWPEIAEPDLVGSIAWVLFDVIERAGDEEVSRAAEATASHPVDRHRPVLGFTYHASSAPEPEAWLAADESDKLAAIEAHHRAFAIDLPNARLHATLHAVVENQLAARSPRETGETLERFVAAGVGRHEAIHAIGSVVAGAIWDVLRRKATVDHEALAEELARLDPRDWRDGEPDPGAPRTIPPLAHELMYRQVPGLRVAVEDAARDLRQRGWTESTLFDPIELLDRSTIGDFLERHAATLVAAGHDRAAAIDDGNLLGVHAFSIVSYELHRRKTFWVDESLAFMLGCTRLDVRGDSGSTRGVALIEWRNQ